MTQPEQPLPVPAPSPGGAEPAISRTGATTGQVPVLQAGGGLAFATPAAGGGVPRLPTLSGGWKIPWQSTGARVQSPGHVLGAVYFTPFLCSGETVNQLSLNFTGVAGSSTRVGIYTSNPTTGLPSTLIVDGGSILGNGGLFGVNIANTVTGNGLFWAATAMQGTAAAQIDSCMNFLVTSSSSGLHFYPSLGAVTCTVATTYTGALPATFATTDLTFSVNMATPSMSWMIA